MLIPLISIALFDRPTSIQQRNLARFSGRQVLELAKDNYVPLNDFSRYNPQHEWGEVKDRKNKERQNKKDPNMLIVIHHAESDVEQASK